MREVLTIGTFDTPHINHAKFLLFCQSIGDTTVGINSDEFVEEYKGKRPLFTYEERARLIANLGFRVMKNESAGRELIEELKPNFIVVGSDWLRRDYLKQIDMTPDRLDEMDISLVYTPYSEGISSTELKKRVYESYRNSDN